MLVFGEVFDLSVPDFCDACTALPERAEWREAGREAEQIIERRQIGFVEGKRTAQRR